jgi:lipopolysaccharide export LptBFGC system permease protein LptF
MFKIKSEGLKETILVIPLIFLLLTMVFSTHFEGEGVSAFFGAIIFSIFPYFKTFRAENWYLVEWSQWAFPFICLVVCLAFGYLVIRALKKKDIQEFAFSMFGCLFLVYASYLGFIHALNF